MEQDNKNGLAALAVLLVSCTLLSVLIMINVLCWRVIL